MSETDPLEAARRLESSMDGLANEIREEKEARQAEQRVLTEYGHRNRQLILALAASILLTLGLGVVAITASLQAREATSQARRNQENAKITCETGNEGRRLQTQLWTYVLDASEKNPNLTAYQKKQIAAFRGYIATVYAQRDCNNAPTIPPGTVTPSR